MHPWVAACLPCWGQARVTQPFRGAPRSTTHTRRNAYYHLLPARNRWRGCGLPVPRIPPPRRRVRAGRNRQQALSVTRQRHWASRPSAHNAPSWLQPCPTGLLHRQISLCSRASLASVTRPTTSPPSAPPLDLPRIGRPARWSHIHLLHLLQRLHVAPPWYRSPCPTAPPPSATGPSTPGQCLSAAQSATQQWV